MSGVCLGWDLRGVYGGHVDPGHLFHELGIASDTRGERPLRILILVVERQLLEEHGLKVLVPIRGRDMLPSVRRQSTENTRDTVR